MNNNKKNPTEKKASIADLYKAGSFYGTISPKDFHKNKR